MNVLFLDQSSSAGGGQRCLCDVIAESVERGWRVTVGLPGPGFLLDAARQAGAGVVVLPCGPYQSGRKSFRDYARFGTDLVRQRSLIAAAVKRSGCRLIYVNGPRLLPAAVLARNRIPLVFHAHSVPRTRMAFRLAGIAAAQASTVICCCEFVAGAYALSVEASRIRIVPNGVSDSGYRPRLPHKTFRMAVVGRIEPAKGQLLAVEALRLIASQTVPCQLDLWGSTAESDPGYVDAIRRAAAGLSVAMRAEGDIGRILSETDLLVLPSLNEGMPRVILEAFSAGVPVLAFATGGIGEVIRNGETGFLVEDRSAQGLAAAFRRVLSLQAAELERVTRRARLAWEQEYTADRFRARVADVMYETVQSAG